jgi:hypothetical protein
MGLYDTGVIAPFDRMGSIVEPIFGIAASSFVNRCPLLTRLPQVPLGAMTFATSTVLYRPTTNPVANGGNPVASGAVVLPMADGSVYQSGDVLEYPATGEIMLVQSIAGNNVTVVRGYAGSATAAIPDTSLIYLIGNTRTGAEINVFGISRIPQVLIQNSQTFQHPYAVGGAVASATDYALPPGVTSVVGRERMMAIQDCSDDIERCYYYGVPVSLNPAAPGGTGANAATKPMMAGLRTQITTNKAVQPTNYSSYGSSDLVRDTVQACFTNGGDPDVLLVGTQWMTAFAKWGTPLLKLDAGETRFGVAVDEFEAPFLGGIKLIACPLMRPFDVFCLSSAEVRQRVKRQMYDKPRGSEGDAEMGDILAEGAIELDNEPHHAYVTGITGFGTS